LNEILARSFGAIIAASLDCDHLQNQRPVSRHGRPCRLAFRIEESSVPTFTELQQRLKRSERASVRLGSEELLVTDARGTMRPGEFVDQKLRAVQGIAASRATARAAARRRHN
jgi:hypothetical protein